MQLIHKKFDKVTAVMIFDKIKEMIARHELRKAAIGIDTLALVFNLKPAEVLTLVAELEESGKVIRRIAPESSRRGTRMGDVTLA